MKKDHRLVHFIKVYDDVITQQSCSDIISYFNLNKPKVTVSSVGVGALDRDIRISDELNVSTLDTVESNKIHKYLTDATLAAMKWYKEDMSEYSQWLPEVTSLESFRIKHYTMNEGYYKTHVDNVGDRAFAVIFYLNDVSVGGETDFPSLGIKVPPKAGRVLIFPTTFMYPHQGTTPLSNDKFIIQGYVNG